MLVVSANRNKVIRVTVCLASEENEQIWYKAIRQMKDKFEKCVDWFYANRETLLPQYHGKYVVCADDKVLGAWNDFTLAAANAVDLGYAPGTFAVQKCVPEADEAVYFHTPRVDFSRTGTLV